MRGELFVTALVICYAYAKWENSSNPSQCEAIQRWLERKDCAPGPQASDQCKRKLYTFCKNNCTETIGHHSICSEISGFKDNCTRLTNRWEKRNCTMKQMPDATRNIEGKPSRHCRQLYGKILDLGGCSVHTLAQTVTTSEAQTTVATTSEAPTTEVKTTEASNTVASTTEAPTMVAAPIEAPAAVATSTEAPTTVATSTEALTTVATSTEALTTVATSTEALTTVATTAETHTTEARIGVVKNADTGNGILWAVNDQGVFHYRRGLADNQPWVTVDGRGTYASVSPSGVLYAVNKQGRIYVRVGSGSPSRPEGTSWRGIDGRLKQLSAGDNMLWGVNWQNQIFYRAGITETKPEGTKWVLVKGRLRHLSVGPSGSLWGVNSQQEIFYRTGVTGPTSGGSGWKRIPGAAVQVSVGAGGVWAVNDFGNVFYRQGTYGYTGSEGSGWARVPGKALKHVSSRDVGVVGVDAAGNVYVRDGVTAANPKGTTWRTISQA